MQSEISVATAQPRPRRFLFLRSTKWKVLFLVLCLFVVWVGYTLWSIHSRRHREKEGAAFIQSLGGKAVMTVPSWLPHPIFDRQPEEFQRVTYAHLQDTSIDDAGLKQIDDLIGLTYLDLRNTKITGSGLASLSRLKNLGLLDLRKTQVSDSGLNSLSRLRKLRILYLEGTQVTKQGAEALRKDIPDCQVIFPAMPN